jgi:hypothetical protein
MIPEYMSSVVVEIPVPAVYEYGVYGIGFTVYVLVFLTIETAAFRLVHGEVQLTVPVVAVIVGQSCPNPENPRRISMIVNILFIK